MLLRSDGATPPPFWRLAEPVRGKLVLAGLLMGAGALSAVLPVAAAMGLVETLVPSAGGDQHATGRAWLLAGALLISLVVSQVLSKIGLMVSHFADATLAEQIRQRQISHLQRLPLVWFSRNSSGRVKKAVEDDLHKVHYLIAHAIPDFVNGAIRPVACLVFLFLVDWRLGLVSLVPLVLALASLPLFLKDATAQFGRYSAGLTELGSAVVEFVRGIAPIKVFEAEGKGHRRFVQRAEWHQRFYGEWWDATKYGAALLHVFTSPMFAVMVSGCGATLLVIHADASPTIVLPAVLLATNVAGPLFLLVQVRRFVREANGAARDIESFLALPTQTTPEGQAVMVGHDVRVERVEFSYDDEHRALDGITADLSPGTVTAIVGPSGSGKSTFASLLPRLIDPDRGAVTIGGIDAQLLPAAHLYAEVGFVFQQTYLLRMSIRDNIAMGRPRASDDEVRDAARAAQIHDRILQLPDGYDTLVGEDARLSGGERQRISIARALLMDTPLLVLDEATAFADPDSEAAIQQALAVLTRGRTLLVVAHRLHTVVRADRILVLDHGRVLESGTHESLVAAGGSYARMWDSYQTARNLVPRPSPVQQGGLT